jgi:Ran GTPase-activating protein (RanGAP) involved in mRNA processing and transport
MDLQILNLSNNYIDDKFGVLLFDKLEKNCPNLKILNLSNNNLTNKVFLNPKIIEAFKNNKFQFIEKFIINHNLLGSKGIIQLFDLLLNCPFLNLLDLSYNGVNQNIFDSDNAVNFFNNRLYYFYTFYFEGNFLSSSETGNLVQCLLNNSTLTYLFLGNNRINDDSMKLLGFLLQNNTNIHSLHINYNDFSIKGIIQFFSSIKSKSYLIELNLANNKINQKGLKFIFDSLKNNHYISSLNLSYNDLSKSNTSEIITNFIETNNTIKNFNLAACHIGLGAKRLFSVLENNKKVSYLDLSVNDIGGNKEIFENISNFLKKNFYIKYLYLDGNFINDKDFEKVITDGIKYNKNLNLLSFKFNRINLENKNFEHDIINSLRLNDHIKEIRLDGNPIKNEKNFSLFKTALKKNGTLENREYIRSNNID